MSDTPELVDLVRGLEERLLRAEVRQSREELSELLAEDFREFGSSGRIFDRARILEHLRVETPMELALHDFRAQVLTGEAVLATYRATVCRPGVEAVSHSLRSSLWCRRGDRWQVLFHQGTKSTEADSRMPAHPDGPLRSGSIETPNRGDHPA